MRYDELMQEQDTTPSGAFSLPGLGVDLLHRVYRTTAIVAGLVALLAWERVGPALALGWLLGACLGLGVLRTTELTVLRFIRPGVQSVRSMLFLTLGKLLGACVVLFLAFFAATRGWINLFGVAFGFPLPGAVLALKLLGRRVVEGSAAVGPEETTRGGTKVT